MVRLDLERELVVHLVDPVEEDGAHLGCHVDLFVEEGFMDRIVELQLEEVLVDVVDVLADHLRVSEVFLIDVFDLMQQSGRVRVRVQFMIN